MAYRNQNEKTPEALIEALQFIEENTGLMGKENPGKAHLSAGGTTLMVMSDRTAFDSQDIFLKYFRDSDLAITYIGEKSTFDGKKAYVELRAE